MATPQYFTAHFGDIPLLVSSISTERGRDIVVQSPFAGDQHTLFDMGRRLQRSSVEVLFAEQPGQAAYTTRYDQLIRAWDSGEIRIFSHPVDGAFRARVENVETSAAADEMAIRASVTFLREDPPQTKFDIGAGVSTTAGPEAVAVAASLANMKLAEIDFGGLADVDFGGLADVDFGVPDEVAAAVEQWSEAGDELDSQRVFLEVQTLSDRIDTAIVDMELTQDPTRYQAYQAMIMLRYQLVRASEAFTSESANVFDLFVDTPQPVLRICTDVYGASLAIERAEQVTHMNRIRTPNLVPRGTTLKMPSIT